MLKRNVIFHGTSIDPDGGPSLPRGSTGIAVRLAQYFLAP
jgi:hypothetical protein